jgi:hypothetical protein
MRSRAEQSSYLRTLMTAALPPTGIAATGDRTHHCPSAVTEAAGELDQAAASRGLAAGHEARRMSLRSATGAMAAEPVPPGAGAIAGP